jgi:hypothetical protein
MWEKVLLVFPHPHPPPRGRECVCFVFLQNLPSLFVLSLSKDGGRAGDGGGYANDIILRHRGWHTRSTV